MASCPRGDILEEVPEIARVKRDRWVFVFCVEMGGHRHSSLASPNRGTEDWRTAVAAEEPYKRLAEPRTGLGSFGIRGFVRPVTRGGGSRVVGGGAVSGSHLLTIAHYFVVRALGIVE